MFTYAGEPTIEHGTSTAPAIKTIESFDPWNCFSYTEWRLDKKLPPMRYIRPNTTASVGTVAVMYYPKSGLRHFAFVEFVSENLILLSETNFKQGEVGFRVIPRNDPALQGFWQPV